MEVRLAAWRSYIADLSLFRKMYLSNLLLVAVPILILCLVCIQLFNGILVQYMIRNSAQNLEVVDRSVSDSLGQARLLFQIVATNPRIQEILEHQQKTTGFDKIGLASEIRSIVDSMVEPKSAVHSMVIHTVTGDHYGSSRVHPLGAQSPYTPGVGGQPPGPEWKDIYPSDGSSYISLVKPVYSAVNGRLLADLELNIDERFLSSLYSVLQYGKTGHFFIVNKDGFVVSSSNKDELGLDVRQEAYFDWMTRHNHEGKVFKQDGERYLITSHRLGNEDLGWIIVGSVPLHELLSDVDAVTRLVIVIGLICVVLVIGTAYFLSKSISKPIIDLSRTMVRAGNGDLGVRMNLSSHSDVGLLARSFNKMLNQISELMQQIYQEQRKKRRYEFIALQAQINPHFLYNTLDSICSLIRLDRRTEAFQSVKALSNFYKIILSKGRDVIAIQDEMENVKSYLQIQKMRYADKFHYVIQTDQRITDKQIVKLSIQPLVENAIYHGLRKKRGSGFIRIVGRLDEGVIRLSVHDDGVGFDPEAKGLFHGPDEPVQRHSFGIRSVDERIKLHFGAEYGVRVESRIGQGTVVELVFPPLALKGDEA